jgi:hypothetical protein
MGSGQPFDVRESFVEDCQTVSGAGDARRYQNREAAPIDDDLRFEALEMVLFREIPCNVRPLASPPALILDSHVDR